MSAHKPFPEEFDARLMCNDPVALAWMWILGYIENLNDMIQTDADDGDGWDHEPISVDEFINAAMANIEGGWECIGRGGTFEGVSVDPTFWDKLALIKEIDIPEDNRNSFFTCSC